MRCTKCKARDDYYKERLKYLDYMKATDTMNEYYVVPSEDDKTRELVFIIWGYRQRI